MAKCPKCGYKLKIFNISQNCPKCKTNLRFYNFEEEFYKSAKLAEINQGAFHVKVRRLKASFTGSKLVISRFALCLLPLLTLLIPAGSFHFEMPYKSVDFSIGLLGIINLFTGSDLNFLISLQGSQFAGAEFGLVLSVVIASLLPALFAVLVILSTLLGFISIKNMQKVICTFSAFGIACSLATLVLMYVNIGKLSNALFFTGNAGVGLYAVVVGFAVVFVLNFILNKNGIPVEYDEGMLERAAIYKEYKAGKVKLEDLPQPVVETEETRKIEEQIRIEEEKIAKGAQL